jgi:hypothetical protein
MVVGLL